MLPEGQTLVATDLVPVVVVTHAWHAGVLHCAAESQFEEREPIVTELLLNTFSVVLKSVVKT
jgi:hypothetical protein